MKICVVDIAICATLKGLDAGWWGSDNDGEDIISRMD